MPLKLSQQEFINKATIIHKNKYDYSYTIYSNSRIPITIVCPMHGKFDQNPHSHLRGYGCKKCAYGDLNTEKIKKQFIEKWGDTYDYSKLEYIDSKTKLLIICPIHGEFKKIYFAHLNANQGCPHCSNQLKIHTKDAIIEKFKSIHGDRYNYSLFNHYKNSHSKIKIICSVHGIFEQSIYAHSAGKNCIQCTLNTKSTAVAIKQFIEVHGSRYDYSKVEYINNYTKIEIVCKKHGSFLQRPHRHMDGAGCGKCNHSKGESFIYNWLTSNEIQFFQQHIFDKCKHIRHLKFDFYLPQYNLCIEYDGSQHYKPQKRFGGYTKFKILKIRDNIKTEYCKQNNIKLLRIPYKKFKCIVAILKKYIDIQ